MFCCLTPLTVLPTFGALLQMCSLANHLGAATPLARADSPSALAKCLGSDLAYPTVMCLLLGGPQRLHSSRAQVDELSYPFELERHSPTFLLIRFSLES
eukprot:6248525-Amphidinium_carterae.1